MTNAIRDSFNLAAEHLSADILLINAGMMPGVDEEVRKALAQRKHARDSVILVLVTSGGLPDIAYRIAMAIRERYENVTICIPGWCKSAGTLLAISGNALLMGIKGEMGPLDVQIAKRDDLGGDRDSGLVINEALARLREESFEIFSDFMLRLIAKSSNAVTLRTAADIAAQLTIGLMSPIFEKIDPMRMGADARAMNIGQDYALRLHAKGKNLRGTEALNMLLNGYPSHSFVIDINEARGLFTNVEPLNGNLANALEQIGLLAVEPSATSVVCFLDGDDSGDSDAQESENAAAGAGDAAGADLDADAATADDVRGNNEEISRQARSGSA